MSQGLSCLLHQQAIKKVSKKYVRTWLIGILRHKGSRTNTQNTAPLIAVVIKVLLPTYIASPLRVCYFLILACLFVGLCWLACLFIYLSVCLFVCFCANEWMDGACWLIGAGAGSSY